MRTTLGILMIMASAALLRAQLGNEIVLPQDKGPKKIDVSSYPPEMQKAYKTFTSKCSKCHTIARPINTTMTKAEWERYVKRMMHKPSSGISDSQGKQIFEFLVYDQEQRKAKNLKAFFPALTDEQIAKLKEK